MNDIHDMTVENAFFDSQLLRAGLKCGTVISEDGRVFKNLLILSILYMCNLKSCLLPQSSSTPSSSTSKLIQLPYLLDREQQILQVPSIDRCD